MCFLRPRGLILSGGGARVVAAAEATTVELVGSRKGKASTAGAATARSRLTAVAEAAVGLLPRSSVSSHLRGNSLLSFFK